MERAVKNHGKRKIICEMEIRYVPVPPEELQVWRRGICRMYDELDEMIQRDRMKKELLELPPETSQGTTGD